MAADVQVSELDFLKAYSSKMNDLRNRSKFVAIGLDIQLRKISDDYSALLNDLRGLENSGKDNCRDIQNRYQRAINECGEESREIIGNTDLEAQQKMEILQMRVETTANAIKNLQMKLKNAGLKTQNYAAQMDSLGDACISYVNRYAETLQQYKDLKK